MASKMAPVLFIPVFGGQGTMTFDSSVALSILTRTASGKFLLDSCFSAFCAELASLESHMTVTVDICASHFKDPPSIVDPPYDTYITNPAFSMPALVLKQTLLYLSYIEDNTAIPDALLPSSFMNILQTNADCGVGIVGFSSGILSACVVATSSSPYMFVCHAVEAYRLALRIGIQSQIYRAQILQSGRHDSRPWGLVLIGISKNLLQQMVHEFNELAGKHLVTITAVMSDKHMTVSGHPEDLASFVLCLPVDVSVQETRLNAMYHCPSQLRAVRDNVLIDVARRKIKFPEKSEIIVPIRSTFTGDLISASVPSESLVDLVIDMVLTQPVNWDLVVRKTTAKILPAITLNLLNIGIGTSLLKEFKNSIHTPQNLNVSDLGHQCKSKILPVVNQDPIAIIGMAANVPGAANVDALWELLEKGQDTLREIPENRFRAADYAGENILGRRLKVREANFVETMDQFDHKFFNVSPREAKSMDPQQRILLQTGYEALENAGYVPYGSPTFDPATFGCYIGSATGDYIQNLRNNIDVYYNTGNLRAFLSGRLSYCLGLSGPSIVLDTACSSSLVAIHQACRSLMNRDCNAALAGGVNAISSPDMFIGLDRGHFLSPSGRCRPFDALADGYSRGEGCGIFILKRLEDALAENDQILGIIRGIEVNQSANAVSITHPHAKTQMNLFSQLLIKSDVHPNAVNVVEAHGTGTQAGDTTELQSIRGVLAVDRTDDNPLYVTSIKANIGHLEAASGCASLAKILMMFRRRVIPRQIFLQTINPRIQHLALDNTVISTENIPWPMPKGNKSRVALINNFGAAGSNSAMLVEEYSAEDTGDCDHHANEISVVFGLSAKDIPSLEILRSKYVSWLQMSTVHLNCLLDMAYTATARRQLYSYRLAVSARTVQQLIPQLQSAPISTVSEAEKGVVFVFSGQGGQYYGMGRTPYLSSVLFKHHIDECEFILKAHGFPGVIDIICNSDLSILASSGDEEQLQSATFCLQYALAKLWISWGIRPQAVVGHSLGEYAALVMAGVMTLEDGLLFVARRARLMFERCPRMTTGMAAVSLGPVKLESILHSNRNFSNISISCYNSEGDCVVSGPLKGLELLAKYIETKGIAKVTRLRVPFGYHSATMLPLVQDLRDLGLKTKTCPPQIPFISTVLGRVILPSDMTFPSQDYLARQCVEPVRFSEGVKSYLTAFPSGTTMTWLEISPHPTIIPMLRCFPALSDSVILGCLRISEEPWSSLSKTLASMYRDNYRLDWRNVFKSLGRHVCISLPSYPFSTQRFWTPFVEEISYDHSGVKGSSIHHCVESHDDGEDKVAIFQTSVSDIRRYIEGHRVGGIPLCPASIYLELAYSAIKLGIELKQIDLADRDITLQGVKFPRPLTLNPETVDDVMLTVQVDIVDCTFVLKSSTPLLDHESINATGGYSLLSKIQIERSFNRILPSVTHRIDAILCPETPRQLETFSARTMYQVIFSRIVDYSAEFQTIQALYMHSNGLEATAAMCFSEADGCNSDNFILHPLFVDTLIHIAGFISNMHASQNDAYVCNEVGSIHVFPPAIKANTTYKIYCKIMPLEDQACMVGESYAILEDPEGSKVIIAHVLDIRFRRVRLGSFLSGLEYNIKLGLGTMNECRSLPSDVAEIVMKIVADACKLDSQDLALDHELEILGVDSLMCIEVSYDISKAFPGFGCRPKEIATCRNINDIVNAILSHESPKYSAGGQSSIGLPITPPSIFSTPRTMVQSPSSMRQIVARILDVEEDLIKDDIPLSYLGLDSLSSIETVHALGQELQLKIPGNLLSGTDTIRDLEAHVSNLEPSLLPDALEKQAGRGRSSSNAFHESLLAIRHKSLSLLQNTTSSRTPLVLIHDGSGLTISYERILPLDRRVWAITNPKFASEEQWTTLEQMAESYTNLIKNEMEGPVILGGWSFGGVVAFEVATQLLNKTFPVKGVILLDSPSPYNHVPLSSCLIDRVLDAAGNIEPKFRNFCKIQFLRNATLLSEYKPSLGHHNLRVSFLKSNEPYALPDSPEYIEVPRWLSDRDDTSFIVEGWQSILDTPINILDIPGHHFQAFETKNVVKTSHRIQEACNYLEDTDSGYIMKV